MESLRYFTPPSAATDREVDVDVVIYCANAAGIIAALQLRQAGHSVAIAEPSGWIGGMTAGGLGATDIGNKEAIGGLARQFYRDLGAHYGVPEAWTFEPSAARKVLEGYLAGAEIPVFFHQQLRSVRKEGNRITELTMEDGAVYRARYFIDTSYEGDLMAAAKVSYTVGREGNARYGETFNGIQFGHPNHNFRRFVDPYRVAGDARSGLCHGVQPGLPGVQGAGDASVQAYNFRLCLTNRDDLRTPFPCPPGYDPEEYELLRRYLAAGVWDALWLNKEMPNRKSDTNNHGGFSTDFIGGNHDWPDATPARREEIFQAHVRYQKGLLYFLANDPGVPAAIREEVNQWGLAGDEFTETGGWPHALYIREGRRMLSEVVMTEHHVLGRDEVEDGVGLGAYQMDSHNCRRIVYGGRVCNEGNVEVSGFAPYPVSYRAIHPRESECANLLVPWCLSASHIAFGSIRMEPVGMVLAQSAAVAIGLALGDERPVQRVEYAALRRELERAGQILDAPVVPFWRGVRPFAL